MQKKSNLSCANRLEYENCWIFLETGSVRTNRALVNAYKFSTGRKPINFDQILIYLQLSLYTTASNAPINVMPHCPPKEQMMGLLHICLHKRSSLCGCNTYTSHEDVSCTKTSQLTSKNELSILCIICWRSVSWSFMQLNQGREHEHWLQSRLILTLYLPYDQNQE